MSNIVYLKLIGEQQGDISCRCGTTDSIGNRWQRNHVNEIFVFSLCSEVTNSGKGANLQSLTFSKQIDKSSPLLMNAINNNENLFLEFWFYRINRYGQWEKYYYIQLRGASISSIQMRVINDEIHTEAISVGYDYILSKHLISNTEFSYLALPAEYNKLFVPVPKPQTQTLNSAGVGRLLAAGGIYNGNIEGFRDTAEKLGGDAVKGYDQVLNEKTVSTAIIAASIAAGYGLGRMELESEIRVLKELEHFGARGISSGRPFNPDLAGGPIENLTTDGVTINYDGIAVVEKHVSRFKHDPANDVMIKRLKDIADGKILHEQVDLNYYTYECREFQRYCNLGWETGEPEGFEGYELWNNAHTATLEEYNLKASDLYHPDAILDD